VAARISRERARLDEWARELAPSDELRRWFDHVPERFEEFRCRYRSELHAHPDKIEELRARESTGPVTILYAARDRQHNNAVTSTRLRLQRAWIAPGWQALQYA
jgi:uncharacterized protein YeaO (DUF488 family)